MGPSPCWKAEKGFGVGYNTTQLHFGPQHATCSRPGSISWSMSISWLISPRGECSACSAREHPGVPPQWDGHRPRRPHTGAGGG